MVMKLETTVSELRTSAPVIEDDLASKLEEMARKG